MRVDNKVLMEAMMWTKHVADLRMVELVTRGTVYQDRGVEVMARQLMMNREVDISLPRDVVVLLVEVGEGAMAESSLMGE